MRKRNFTWLRAALALLAIVLGTVGYRQAYGGDLLAAMYSAMRVFIINVDVPRDEMNLWIQIARWLGVGLSLSIAYSIASVLSAWLGGRVRAARKDAVSLHGDAVYVSAMAAALGRRAVLRDDRFLARTHVIAFEREDALAVYIGEHLLDLRRCERAYICAMRAPENGLKTEGLIVRNIPWMCARQYWQAHYLRKQERTVALIGLSAYGSALLSEALQVNVFTQGDTVCYHVFGDSADFRAMHPMLGSAAAIGETVQGRDSVFFHTEPWREARTLLAACDRVILCPDTDGESADALYDLSRMLTCGAVHVRASGGDVFHALFDVQGLDIVPFGTAEMLYSPENVLLDKMTVAGRRIDAIYMQNHVCMECWQDCLTCRKNIDNWNAMGAFLQGSNLAQADHMHVKIRLLLDDFDRPIDERAVEDAKAAYEREKKGGDRSDRLNAIEHERWMRYHFMNGWSYAPLQKKDAQKRLHPCLVPYDALSENDKVKDTGAWEALFLLLP